MTFFQVLIAFALLVAVGVYGLDHRHRRLRPHCQPYGWGYFVGLAGFLQPVNVMFLAGRVDETTFSVFAYISVPVYWALAILTLRRNRWGLVWLTVLSFNPLWWIINPVYLKNRWEELEGAPQKLTVTRCAEPGCGAAVTCTGTVMGTSFYRCTAGHEFTG